MSMLLTTGVAGEEPITAMVVKFENKYGRFERDVLTMPLATMKAYIQAGASHVHGNVVASSVTSDIRQKIAGKNGKTSDVTKEQIQAWRKAHVDECKALEAAAYAESLVDADKGEIGVREGGPRLDPVEREFRNLVLARATALCEGLGAKMPGAAKDGEQAPTITLAGDNTVLTRVELLARIANSPKHGPELRKQAERTVAARERVATQAKADAQKSATAESLF